MNKSLLSTLLLLIACSGGDAETDPVPRVPVTVDLVRLDTLPNEVRLTGRLTAIPGGSAVLTAPAAGVVHGLRIRIGTVVRSGETLATIDVPELAASAQQLAATAAVAEREAARQKSLLADGVTAAKRADEANAAALSARAAADAAERLQGRTRISTPLSGTVLRVLVREGERVEAGATIAEVVSAGALDLIASVPAAALSHLKVGQPVVIHAEGDSAAYGASLTALGPGIDSLTNAGQAVIRVSNADHHLRPGLGATALVRMGTHEGVLSVPEASLVVLGGETSIFLVGADTLAHARAVTTGVRHGGRVEVEGDSVAAGARVVTVGAAGLQDGMHVVTEKPAP